MKRLLWLLLVAACAWAQDTKTVLKVIELKYADANRVANLVRAPAVIVAPDSSMHVLSVLGPADGIASIEEIVKQLDVAPPNIELAVYLISGSSQNAADDLPKELAPTAKQLHGLFSYKGYRMLESFVLRGRDGRPASTSGMLPGTRSTYNFRYQSATVSSGTPRLVHIDGMVLNVGTPTQRANKNNDLIYDNAGLNTDIDVGEGQKVVVGKSDVSGSEDAMILVVTAKVVD